eukprot:PhM_4_TR13403/c0_g1_i1/m.29316
MKSFTPCPPQRRTAHPSTLAKTLRRSSPSRSASVYFDAAAASGHSFAMECGRNEAASATAFYKHQQPRGTSLRLLKIRQVMATELSEENARFMLVFEEYVCRLLLQERALRLIHVDSEVNDRMLWSRVFALCKNCTPFDGLALICAESREFILTREIVETDRIVNVFYLIQREVRMRQSLRQAETHALRALESRLGDTLRLVKNESSKQVARVWASDFDTWMQSRASRLLRLPMAAPAPASSPASALIERDEMTARQRFVRDYHRRGSVVFTFVVGEIELLWRDFIEVDSQQSVERGVAALWAQSKLRAREREEAASRIQRCGRASIIRRYTSLLLTASTRANSIMNCWWSETEQLLWNSKFSHAVAEEATRRSYITGIWDENCILWAEDTWAALGEDLERSETRARMRIAEDVKSTTWGMLLRASAIIQHSHLEINEHSGRRAIINSSVRAFEALSSCYGLGTDEIDSRDIISRGETQERSRLHSALEVDIIKSCAKTTTYAPGDALALVCRAGGSICGLPLLSRLLVLDGEGDASLSSVSHHPPGSSGSDKNDTDTIDGDLRQMSATMEPVVELETTVVPCCFPNLDAFLDHDPEKEQHSNLALLAETRGRLASCENVIRDDDDDDDNTAPAILNDADDDVRRERFAAQLVDTAFNNVLMKMLQAQRQQAVDEEE